MKKNIIGTITQDHHAAIAIAVLVHVQASLDPSEFARMRAIAARGTIEPTDPIQTLADLIRTALAENTLPVAKILAAFPDEAMAIHEVDGQPLYYVQGRGIYCWALDPEQPASVSLWLTHPAYPPGW